MDKILHDLKDGNYGIFLIMGRAGFCPSTVSVSGSGRFRPRLRETELHFLKSLGTKGA